MAFRWQRILILLVLILSGERNFAASSTKEERAYAAAASMFQDEMWHRAEMEFAQFVEKYPESTNVPEAVLAQAQAEFKQGKFAPAIALLTARKTQAGNLADQYIYWIAEAQFQNAKYAAAAENFNLLAQNFSESPLRLRAAVGAAAALAQLGDWVSAEKLLEKTSGVFQRAVRLDSGNELVSRGRLLLASAKFAQKDFDGAAAILESINSQTLMPELDWQRNYLLYQVKIAAGDLNAALAVTANLLQIARLEPGADSLTNLSASVALRAGVLEKLNRPGEAIAAYEKNLATNAPDQWQRQAILKIAELALAQKQFSSAEQSLQNFLAQFPNSPSADMALLTLGELYLKNYVAQPMAVNQLPSAQTNFDLLINTFTNSPFTGKAYLDRGWCDWLAGKIPESLADFEMAVEKLPPSEDLAVARFKMGDAQFKLNNFSGALANYQAVLNDFSDFPAVERALGEQALYQSLRANLALNDSSGAQATLAQILKTFPAGDLSDNAILLVAENTADAHQPKAARQLLRQFERQFPNSELRPQAELAIARTYELEQNWPAVITNYENWLGDFSTDALRPQVDYALALADFQAGKETNAFTQFTNFVAQFPTNDLAPQAQWWVADYFYRAGDFVNAEKNYKNIFQNTNWQNSPLIYQARMMAGRAAIGRAGYLDAIGYFTSLTGDTNCPPALNAQALFAWGGALMLSDSPDTNNPLANFQSATNVFSQIIQTYPTNDLAALAWIKIGECNLQLTNYDAATNAYAQVFNSAPANISARSQAQIGFGIALEKKAALAAGREQTNLLQRALDNYLDVFETGFGKNLRDGEMADAFWVKKAGLQALPLIQSLGVSPPEKFIDQMERLLPPLKNSLEKMRATFSPVKN